MIPDELVIKTLEKINKTPVAYNYFFNNINNPAWLIPLKENGFFTKPTPAVREDGYIQFPVWPESGYLVRVASRAQDEVLEIVKALPDTDNERVMDDVVRALLEIDTPKVFRQTELVKKYINKPQFLLLSESAAAFVCKLADGGYDRPALGLAKEMLEVLPDPEKEEKLKSDYVMLKPATKFREHDYKTIAEKVTPSLAKASPLGTIDMYAALLQNAIGYEYTYFKFAEDDTENVTNDEKQDDLSYIWRPKIAESNEHSHDAEDVLTTALLDSVIALMKDTSISDKEKFVKLNELAANKYSIFKRIVEFGLREHKNNLALKPFYDSLLKDKQLKHILKNEKEGVGGITTGFVNENPTAILKDLSDDRLIETLRTYKDETGWSFERDSLSKELSGLIKSDPSRFVTLIGRIASTKNEYFDETIRAFEEVIDEITEDDVINIIEALINIYEAGNTVEEPEKREYFDWSKSSSIRLVEKLLSKKEDENERITVQSLATITKLLLILTRTEAPNSTDSSNFEPVDLSINSNRGKALHALVYLLAWMNRNKFDKAHYEPIFDELDWHLDPRNEPSPAMHAVYGWRFEILYGTDEAWATKNIDKIFSEDELGNAAFDAYVMFNRVHEDALQVLGEVFKRQIPRLAVAPPDDGKARHDGLKNFVQHMALHYWFTDLDLSDGSIMSTLLNTADKKYVKELANFIGFRLYKSKQAEEGEHLEKLVKLWEFIVDLTKRDDTKLEALQEFGTWFASGKFDPGWSLEQLTYSASKAGDINLDFAALEYMETIAEQYSEETIKALAAMVDGTRDRWSVSSWSKNATAIIMSAYTSGDENAKLAAKALANKLVAKGHTEYRSVISNT